MLILLGRVKKHMEGLSLESFCLDAMLAYFFPVGEEASGRFDGGTTHAISGGLAWKEVV